MIFWIGSTHAKTTALSSHIHQQAIAPICALACPLIASEGGEPSIGAGERIVRRIAAKEQRQLHQEDGKVWYSYSQAASEGSPGSTVTFWQVGVGSHTALVSCFIDSAEGDAATKERVTNTVLPLIRSFRVDDTTV